jgi:hypothetical protein
MAKKAKKKAAPKKAAKPSKIPKLRARVLPGMEQVRNTRMMAICEGIADARETMNEARGREQQLLNSALTEMVTKKVSVYRHARVEIVAVPGDVHLRVRMIKTEANADGQDPAKILETLTAGHEDADDPSPVVP